MKIVRDEPQQLLVFETPVFALPPAAVGCAGVVIVGLVFGVAGFGLLESLLRGERPQGIELALSLVFPGIVALVAVVVFFRLRAMLRYPQRLRVDRHAGELELAEIALLGGSGTSVLRLDQIERMVVATAMVKPNLGDFQAGVRSQASRLGLKLRLDWRDEGGKTQSRSLQFSVEDMDKREEVADLAYRLARAAGLFYARVVRSDPRDLELELLRERVPGAEPVPLIEKPAEYAKDVVLPQAARVATQERVAAFVPGEFRGDLAVQTWEPRREVRFGKGLGFAAIGCLPFTLLVLAGPVLLYLSADGAADRQQDRFVVAGVLGLLGLVFGGLAIAAVVSSLPRSVSLDWTRGTVERRGAFKTRTFMLSEIRELELKCVRQYHSSKNSSYHSYRCEVVAHLRANPPEPARAETIVETTRFREDADSPYRIGLPLATELAAALGVPRRVTDFS